MNSLQTKYTNSLVPLLNSCSSIHEAAVTCADSPASEFPLQITGIKGSLYAFFIHQISERIKLNTLHDRQYNNKFAQFQKDFLIIVSNQKEADECENDLLTSFGEENISIHKLPWWGSIPYRPAAKGSAVFGERAGILAKMAIKNPITSKPRIFILSQRSLINPVPPAEYTRTLVTVLKKGQTFDSGLLAEKLISQGYTRVPKVGMKGEFALRGEVMDIFMSGEEYAHRIVFDFDTIEQIKTFELETQTSKKAEDTLVIYPMKEVVWTDELAGKLEDVFSSMEKGIKNNYAEYDAARRSSVAENSFENKTNDSLSDEAAISSGEIQLSLTQAALVEKERIIEELMLNRETEGEELFYGCLWDRTYTVMDYIEKDTPVFCCDYDRMLNAFKMLTNEYEVSYRTARQQLPVLPPRKMQADFIELLKQSTRLNAFRSLETMSNTADDNSSEAKKTDTDYTGTDPIVFNTSLKISCDSGQSFFGNINYFKEQLISFFEMGYKVFIFADNQNQALRMKEILKDFTEIFIIPQAISGGFALSEEKILVIQEDEIFGRKKKAPSSIRKAKSKAIDTFVELNPGDFIVHINYGIGLFKGIERIKAMGTERDYIKLEYAEEEIVFVPIEQVNMVQRYIGSGDSKPKLDKIGGKSWNARKAKTQAKVEEIAEKLIDLYSKRQASRGFPFPKDTEWSAAFEASFPYEDTPDQATATKDIKEDMERPVPMDRLVCGDVGYGKTEIAMRAAFKAVMGGKQVAFLAPTTILAEQHYENCIERFRNFPVKIAQMSRFVSPGEQKKILERLHKGDVDILVGTHRIIQKDVLFKDLGLMIIDEEQRFGVKDKEKLKIMKHNIDSLALSATPIPRTLHMSLLKIRDMSLLTTPPQNRQSVETVIEEYNEEKVARAIRSEVARGGQVFYLHNRVESLEEIRIKLEKMLPELMVDVAHGQMTSEELDDIFRRFKMGGFHILVATTIIENGIDIPNVNTIIIDRADMYGVSQLYQLRGRVGRSDRKAYAYLFYPENKALSDVAMKRLQVISDFTELGSGFKIAMKDMEIRGAGNLLGKDQSGEVYAVGFEMYLNLLNSAIERLSNSNWRPEEEVLLELEYTGFIPDSYIKDAQTKMELYKKIAGIQSQEELNTVWEELLDRFGPLPEEVESLLSLAKIRIICHKLSISSLKEKKNTVYVEFAEVSKISVDKVLKLIKLSGGKVRLDPSAANRLIMQTGTIDLKSKSEFIKEKLEMLN